MDESTAHSHAEQSLTLQKMMAVHDLLTWAPTPILFSWHGEMWGQVCMHHLS